MGMLDNVFFLALLAWPGVLVGCALMNMLCQWSFSWSELILDYLAGVVVGLFFYFGTERNAHPALQFFLVFSDGLPGLLHVAGVQALQARDALFAVSAGLIGGSVLLAGALDRASMAIGTSMNVGGGLLSILILPLKLPWSFCTTSVGLLMFLVGCITAAIRRYDPANPSKSYTRVGILGGVPYVEWSVGGSDYWATTLGATFMVWKGDVANVVKHELYHTRQYVYLHDWLIPFWLLGGLWGLASAGIYNATLSTADAHKSVDVLRNFSAAEPDREVGNPLERAAYGA